MTKMTKRERFEAMIKFMEVAPANMDATPEGVDPEQFLEDNIAFMVNEIALIDRKRNAPKAKTATQVENDALKVRIVDMLDTPMRANEIAKALGEDIKVQKVTALMTQLVKEERVIRTVNKKVVTFTRA